MNDIINELDPNLQWSVHITWESCLFGHHNPAYDLILLLMKQYIMRIRYKPLPIMNLMKNMFEHIISEKQYTKTSNFDLKWIEFRFLVEKSVQYEQTFKIQ